MSHITTQLRPVIFLLVTLLPLGLLRAGDTPDQIIAPFVDEQTTLIAFVDVENLELDNLQETVDQGSPRRSGQ